MTVCCNILRLRVSFDVVYLRFDNISMCQITQTLAMHWSILWQFAQSAHIKARNSKQLVNIYDKVVIFRIFWKKFPANLQFDEEKKIEIFFVIFDAINSCHANWDAMRFNLFWPYSWPLHWHLNVKLQFRANFLCLPQKNSSVTQTYGEFCTKHTNCFDSPNSTNFISSFEDIEYIKSVIIWKLSLFCEFIWIFWVKKGNFVF